ncbi:LOW QUALITY PROTEIN: GTP-binding protein RAD [Rhinoraja longicauda]
MTLNKPERSRAAERRRASAPLQAQLHRRSMPVDERELRAAGEGRPGPAQPPTWTPGSSDSFTSSGSESGSGPYKVLVLGGRGVGKTSLARIFGGVEEGGSHEGDGREGRSCAVVFNCKFIETSAALQHRVRELFEGITRQIRLRRDSKEDNERRQACAQRRQSVGQRARRFLGRLVARNNKKMAFRQKSKSCHDLSVL